ncbi:MAG: DUF934 domain-containing protein [Oceanobacter sp.]
MAKLIKGQELVAADNWQRINDDQMAEDYAIISLDRWIHQQAELQPLADRGVLGVHLNADQTADLLAEQCQQFALISIDFPKFADGRGYSAARLLREKYGFEGELRAVGDVLVDQVFFMQRTGFTSLALREDQDENEALAALKTFSAPYQTGTTETDSLFRRVQRG